MSLLRGTGARKAGSFQRGGAVSSALGVPVIRGACTAGKVMSVAIAASLAPRGAPVGQKTIAAAIAGRLNPSAAAGTPKIGTTSISATWSRFAADAFVKTGSFAEAGRLTLLGATEFLRDGRTVARYSRLSLALVPADRAGSFARTPGFHSYGRITVRGVETSLKIVSVDELARARFSAAVTAGKFQVFDQSGRIVARGLDTSEKIGETDVAGSALFAAASTGQSITGPTYDMRGRVLVFSQSTNAKSIDDGGGAGLVLDRSSSTAEKGGLTAVAARATFVASLTTGRAPSTNVVTRFVAVAQTTGGLIVLPLGIGRLVPLGSSTFEKIFTSFDHAPRAVFAASSSAEKVMTVDVAGAVGLMRARSTNAPPVVRGRGGGSRPRAIGTSRPPSRGSNRPPNQ